MKFSAPYVFYCTSNRLSLSAVAAVILISSFTEHVLLFCWMAGGKYRSLPVNVAVVDDTIHGGTAGR